MTLRGRSAKSLETCDRSKYITGKGTCSQRCSAEHELAGGNFSHKKERIEDIVFLGSTTKVEKSMGMEIIASTVRDVCAVTPNLAAFRSYLYDKYLPESGSWLWGQYFAWEEEVSLQSHTEL